jgi:hypothetical protein
MMSPVSQKWKSDKELKVVHGSNVHRDRQRVSGAGKLLTKRTQGREERGQTVGVKFGLEAQLLLFKVIRQLRIMPKRQSHGEEVQGL